MYDINKKDNKISKSTSQIIAGVLAFIMILFALTYFPFVLLVSYNSPLRLFMVLMFIVIIVLSAIHWINGKFRNTWIISIFFIVFIQLFDAWLIKKNNLEFCKHLIESCKLNPKGEIDCISGTRACKRILGDDYKL